MAISRTTPRFLAQTALPQRKKNVKTINELNFMGKVDPLVVDYAKQENRVLLTRNCKDFENLHPENPNHPGILAIYSDSNPSKDLS